ncbi:MAG: type II secretion system secretin GspD [Rhodocyclaceae bacterium]|jgi:general secretion pathway protein D|nr:type II secretion system secretin GspD [Rhodocyclaceae bacterium]MBK6907299.1 type II secretion system secretin GspD [Rhodocyclaceae bacterium]
MISIPISLRKPSVLVGIALGVFLLLFFAKQVGATEASKTERVMLNFVSADIESVVRAIGKATGKNFIIDPRVKGTINVVSSSPVTPALAYDILLAALRLQGFTAVERRGAIVILPEADAKFRASAVTSLGKDSRGEQMVTEVFTLKYESATQLLPIVRSLVSPNNPVTAHATSNTLVVTDYAENVRRLAQLIDSIDQPSAFEPVIIPVKHATAADIADAVSRILANGSAAAPGGAGTEGVERISVVAEPRLNSLILRSDNPSRVARVRALIERLDVPGSTPGNIHVIYLRNAEAVMLAQTLRSMLSGNTSTAASPATTSLASSAGASAPASATGSAGGGMGSAVSASAASGYSGSTGSSAPSGQGIVQADAAANALIITASDAVFNNLRSVIEKLDVKRAQVYIEALIVEVTADKATEFGVQWQRGSLGSAQNSVIGGTNFSTGGNNNIFSVPQVSLTPNLPTPGAGLNIGLLNSIRLANGTVVPNLSVLAHALETDSNANILSTPNLLTMDNEQASIVIGQNVPFITGQYAQTGTTATATPFQTIERKDVGLTLKVKPQISEGGSVRLQVFQEVSSVDTTSTNNASGITTNKRSLESTVSLQDGQTIVLGGLIQDSITNGVEKVPLLGDIPLLGALFSFDKKRRTKTNLMVFLRPTIVRDDALASRLTKDRYNFVIGEQTSPVFDGARRSELLTFPAENAMPPAAIAPAQVPQPAATATP